MSQSSTTQPQRGTGVPEAPTTGGAMVQFNCTLPCPTGVASASGPPRPCPTGVESEVAASGPRSLRRKYSTAPYMLDLDTVRRTRLGSPPGGRHSTATVPVAPTAHASLPRTRAEDHPRHIVPPPRLSPSNRRPWAGQLLLGNRFQTVGGRNRGTLTMSESCPTRFHSSARYPANIRP